MILRHEDLSGLACLFLGAYGGNFIDLIARFPTREEHPGAPGGARQPRARPGSVRRLPSLPLPR